MKITYNDITNEDKKLIVCYFDTKDRISSGISKTINKGTTNNSRYIPNYFSATYDSTIEYQLSLVKDDFSAFSVSDIREINRWLINKDTPCQLKCEYDDETFLYNGVFTSVEYVNAGIGIVGLVYSFTNNSPFAYIQASNSYNVLANGTINISCDSDLVEGYVYPTFNIANTTSTSKTITITNETDDNKTLTITVPANTTLKFQCQNQIITNGQNSVSYEDLGIDDNTNIYWLRFISGINTLTFDDTCTFSYELLLPIKLGEMHEY